MGGESWRIGCEKGERPLGVLTVFSEMEMHAAYMPPAAVVRGEKSIEARAACGEFVLEGLSKLLPQSCERRFARKAGKLLVPRVRRACLARAAAGRDEPNRQRAPEGEIGG